MALTREQLGQLFQAGKIDGNTYEAEMLKRDQEQPMVTHNSTAPAADAGLGGAGGTGGTPSLSPSVTPQGGTLGAAPDVPMATSVAMPTDTGQLTTSAAKPIATSDFATFAPTAASAQVAAPLEEAKKPIVTGGGGTLRGPSAMQMESNAANAQHDSLTKLNDQRMKTETELGAAAQAKAQADLKYNEEFAAGLQQQEAKRAQDEARRMEELKRGEQDFAEFSKNPPKEVLDPEQYWKSKGTGGQALGMIGILLSGIATGLQGPGAQNVALGILDKKIDADINAQKFNIDNNKDTWKTQLANKKTLLGMSRDRFGDERQGELAAKSAMIGLYEQKIRTEAARFGTAEAQANAENVLAVLGEKRVAINDEFAKRQILVQQRKEAQAAAAAAAARAAAETAGERKIGVYTIGGKKYEMTPGGKLVALGEAGKADLETASKKGHGPGFTRRAEIQSQIQQLKQGRDAISKLKVSEDETLPALGVGGKVANLASTVLGDQSGRHLSEEGKTVAGVMQNNFSAFKRAGENSDADAIRIKERIVGDGTKKGMVRNFDAQIESLMTELQALEN